MFSSLLLIRPTSGTAWTGIWNVAFPFRINSRWWHGTLVGERYGRPWLCPVAHTVASFLARLCYGGVATRCLSVLSFVWRATDPLVRVRCHAFIWTQRFFTFAFMRWFLRFSFWFFAWLFLTSTATWTCGIDRHFADALFNFNTLTFDILLLFFVFYGTVALCRSAIARFSAANFVIANSRGSRYWTYYLHCSATCLSPKPIKLFWGKVMYIRCRGADIIMEL